MGNKIENLLSRVAALEECFDSLPSGVAQQRCQKGLIVYATIPPLFPMLISSQQAQSNRGTTTVVVRKAGVASAY